MKPYILYISAWKALYRSDNAGNQITIQWNRFEYKRFLCRLVTKKFKHIKRK